MSDKPSQPQDDAYSEASDLEILGASMAYRLFEFLVTEKGQTGERMEELLKNVLTIPAMIKVAVNVLKRLEETEPKAWQRGIQEFLAEWVVFNNRSERALDPDCPDISEWSPRERAMAMLDLLSWEGSLPQFATQLRSNIVELLENIIRGDQLDMDWLKGIFTSEAEKSRDMMNLAFPALGGEELAEQVASAVAMFRKKMMSSNELLVAIEIMENEIKLSEPSSKFSPGWQRVNRRALRRLYAKDLSFPGPREYNEDEDRDTWSEEYSLVEEVIYNDLWRRIYNDPAGLLRDQLQGKLANSLCLAAEHRALDYIRYLRAQKRDIMLRDSLESELQTYDGDDADDLTLEEIIPSGEDGLAEALECTRGYSGLIDGLDDDETEVLIRYYLEEREIIEVAEIMDIHDSTVKKKKARAIKKLRQHLEGSDVA